MYQESEECQQARARAKESVGLAVEQSHYDAMDADASPGDLEVAAHALSAIAEKRLEISLHPVWDENLAKVLYHDCHFDVIGEDGRSVSENVFRPALERLYAIQSFDKFALSLVLDTLTRGAFQTLAVKVSSCSALQGKWLANLTRRVVRRPDVATRLLVELTDFTAFTTADDLIKFADGVRTLGCQIAARHLGVDDPALSRLIELGPDVVKVYPFSRAPSARHAGGQGAIKQLIASASTLSETVVACGVEDETKSAIARAAGATWQQGSLCEPAWMQLGYS